MYCLFARLTTASVSDLLYVALLVGAVRDLACCVLNLLIREAQVIVCSASHLCMFAMHARQSWHLPSIHAKCSLTLPHDHGWPVH